VKGKIYFCRALYKEPCLKVPYVCTTLYIALLCHNSLTKIKVIIQETYFSMPKKSGEQAIDMIYLYMLIIWEVETNPGAWASALMQPIYKGGGKDGHSLVSYQGIYLLNTLTELF